MHPQRIATSSPIVSKPCRVIFASSIPLKQSNRSAKVYLFVNTLVTYHLL
jgi:hypothetical protein